jgi:hypothetical protein
MFKIMILVVSREKKIFSINYCINSQNFVSADLYYKFAPSTKNLKEADSLFYLLNLNFKKI